MRFFQHKYRPVAPTQEQWESDQERWRRDDEEDAEEARQHEARAREELARAFEPLPEPVRLEIKLRIAVEFAMQPSRGLDDWRTREGVYLEHCAAAARLFVSDTK